MVALKLGKIQGCRYQNNNIKFFNAISARHGIIKIGHKILTRQAQKYVNIHEAINKLDYGVNGCLGFQFKNGVGVELSAMYSQRNIFNINSSKKFISDKYTYPAYIPHDAKG